VSISIEDVQKVAKLAKLEFDAEQLELLARQLDQVVVYVEKLNELDTDDVKPTSHVLDLKNVFRCDEVDNWLTQEQVLQNAPVKKHGYFSVPKVIG
jgi:aspartyl-tRNA(Asn)/glutamyl-tRNA(Gln) amidotransferase subunit C